MKQFQITSPFFPDLSCNDGEVAVLLFSCFQTAELRGWIGQRLGCLYVKVDGLFVLDFIPGGLQ